MKLVSFSVSNYRSITKAHKLPISDFTILIGPNNEGKSNILRALTTANHILTNMRRVNVKQGKVIIPVWRLAEFYDWERDFPVTQQNFNPDGKTIFTLEFQLTAKDIDEFKKEVSSSIKGTLPVQIFLGRDYPEFRVSKRGFGATFLSKKGTEIANFLMNQLNFQYIPPIRTAGSAKTIIEEMVGRVLKLADRIEGYQQASAKMLEIQNSILQYVSDNLVKTLREFIPEVRVVNVSITEPIKRKPSCEIEIDDGVPTLLEYKGDGVKSLVAMALMRYTSDQTSLGKDLILAIEEPESHLHPEAVHKLKRILQEISSNSQIIMSTHCPVLVDRRNIQNNIIVKTNQAKPAKKICDVRKSLGVKVSDNLQHAELILVVEGEDDCIALKSLLSYKSRRLKTAIDNGTLALEPLLGASKLVYKLTTLHDAVCNYHVFIDDDKEGHDAAKKAEANNLIEFANINFTSCQGFDEAELEDMYQPSVYDSMINANFGFSLLKYTRDKTKKWSVRIKAAAKAQGHPLDDEKEMRVKLTVAKIVAKNPGVALNKHKRSAFDSLSEALEVRLKEL